VHFVVKENEEDGRGRRRRINHEKHETHEKENS
jgi:hypothetical protein